MKIFKIIVFYPFLILTIIISGCTSGEKKTVLADIDNLIIQVNDLKIRMDSIPLDSVEHYYKLILDQNKIFKLKLNTLPENMGTRDLLFSYGNVEKGFKKLPSKLKSLKKEAEISLDQLNDLKYDIDKNALSKEEYLKFFKEEKEVIDKINSESKQICNVLNKHINDYNLLKKDVILYIDSLQTTEDKY